MPDASKTPLDRAFEAGATSVNVFRFGDEFTAHVAAHRFEHDGARSVGSSASAEGRGLTAEDAIQDALEQIGRAELGAESTAIAVTDDATVAPPREVLQPEVMDPPLRYAVVGRPGEFVTRKEAES